MRVFCYAQGVARALHGAGIPVWRIEWSLSRVARGLGLPGAQFGCVASFVLATFEQPHGDSINPMSSMPGGKTLFTRTSAGLNMAKLDAVDNLARRLSSYATNLPNEYQLHGPLMAQALSGVKNRLDAVEQRVISLRSRFKHADEVAVALLALASRGPGFFFFSQMNGASVEEEVCVNSPQNDALQHATQLSIGSAIEVPMKCAPSTESVQQLPNSFTFHDAKPNGQRRLHEQRRITFLELAVDDGLAALKVINDAKPIYKPWMRVLAMGVSSVGCAVSFFGASAADALVSFVLGLLVGVMNLFFSTHGERFSRSFEFMASLMVSFCSRVVDSTVVNLCVQTVNLSGVIWLVQGWTIVTALVEVATGNAITGTTHLFVGIVITALMGFGMDVGKALGDLFSFTPLASQNLSCDTLNGTICTACDIHLSNFWILLFFPLTAIAFSVLLNALPRQLPMMTALSCVAFSLSYALSYSKSMSPMSGFVAAAIVGFLGNVYGNLSGKSAVPATASGIFVLLPGCMALRSILDMFTGATTAGLGLTSQVLTASTQIAAGLFFASLVVIPREIADVSRDGPTSNIKKIRSFFGLVPESADPALIRSQSASVLIRRQNTYRKNISLQPTTMGL